MSVETAGEGLKENVANYSGIRARGTGLEEKRGKIAYCILFGSQAPWAGK